MLLGVSGLPQSILSFTYLRSRCGLKSKQSVFASYSTPQGKRHDPEVPDHSPRVHVNSDNNWSFASVVRIKLEPIYVRAAEVASVAESAVCLYTLLNSNSLALTLHGVFSDPVADYAVLTTAFTMFILILFWM